MSLEIDQPFVLAKQPTMDLLAGLLVGGNPIVALKANEHGEYYLQQVRSIASLSPDEIIRWGQIEAQLEANSPNKKLMEAHLRQRLGRRMRGDRTVVFNHISGQFE